MGLYKFNLKFDSFSFHVAIIILLYYFIIYHLPAASLEL
jgi:hypothetical protein